MINLTYDERLFDMWMEKQDLKVKGCKLKVNG